MPRNNEIPSYESLLEFQEVYLRAVALAWVDDEFKSLLLRDARSALADYLGYECPWNVDLRVAEPIGPNVGWDPRNKTWTLPRMLTSFGLPNKPEAFEEQLVAFAAYNDAGPSYLFTCC
jgi:ribosomally synthesized peptide (two-chain TOMM family)